MPHQVGAKLRKADFEVPFPWSETVKLTRRYRDGWFDARDTGKHSEKIGKFNSRGRDAYLAGFAAGYKHRPLPTVSVSIDDGQPMRVTEIDGATVTERWTPLEGGGYLRQVEDGRLPPPQPFDPRVERP